MCSVVEIKRKIEDDTPLILHWRKLNRHLTDCDSSAACTSERRDKGPSFYEWMRTCPLWAFFSGTPPPPWGRMRTSKKIASFSKWRVFVFAHCTRSVLLLKVSVCSLNLQKNRMILVVKTSKTYVTCVLLDAIFLFRMRTDDHKWARPPPHPLKAEWGRVLFHL